MARWTVNRSAENLPACFARRADKLSALRSAVVPWLLSVCSIIVLGADSNPDVLLPASQRFESAAVQEAPDFQRHVIPLFGRIGCNGRECHGSFQGKGDFRLSLFGYDFKADHEALTAQKGDSDQLRVSLRQPESSLLLRKPTRQIKHEGGRKIELDSWQYHLLRQWIRSGAQTMGSQGTLERLEVEPSEVLFRARGETRPIQVIAVWSDGTREDVTCLCRFRSNDEAVAVIDEKGLMTAVRPGDTHVVAFYDNGVAAVPILVPVSDRVAANYPDIESPTQIDRLVLAKLRKLGVTPSERSGDAQFLRRLSIDLTGTLPTPGEIEEFLADTDPIKRTRKIDELLARPAYAAWWANKLCDFTGNNPFQQSELREVFSEQWFHWIYRRVLENQPYDELVEGIVLATGREPEQDYEDYAREMSGYFSKAEPADYADRSTLAHFWTRRSVSEPTDKALSFAHSFLGLQLQCAQCHKHPFDQWTQQDFAQFTKFFEPIQYGVSEESQGAYAAIAKRAGAKVKGERGVAISSELLGHAEEGRTIPFRELYVANLARTETEDSSGENPSTAQRVELLRSRHLRLQAGEDPRKPLFDWMVDSKNPYFARAFVNRVWANYFHQGIVNPPDDLNAGNPPSNEPLLKYLTQRFIGSGFDMKQLHREITRSETYQRDWRPNSTNAGDRRNFSRAIPRRLPAEVVYDSLRQITAADDELERVRADLDRRAVGHLSMRMSGTYAMNIFGKPSRAANCDCERSADTSMLQSIFLKNDPLVRQRLNQSGWLKNIEARDLEVGRGRDVAVGRLIQEAYLRTLNRLPTQAELDRAASHVAERESPALGIKDLLWALLNTKEFILNH